MGDAELNLVQGPPVVSPEAGPAVLLGYQGPRAEWVAQAVAGDATAAIRLGDWELSHGTVARAHAWFEYGTRLGDSDAQDHLVWVQGFMDADAREAAAEFSARIALRTLPPNS